MDQEELLLVLHNKGGMREMEETGIYPDYLIFESTKYAKEWDRINLVNRKIKGVLKLKNEPLYNFDYKKGMLTITDTNDQPVKFELIDRLSD